MKKFLLLILLCISMLKAHALEEVIPSYDILLPEFQECFVQSTQVPTDFDVFNPQRYEVWVSLQENPDSYADCLASYTQALSKTFVEVYAAAIEGLSFAEFVDLINKADVTKFTYQSPSEIMQSKYANVANKITLSNAFQKKCKQFKTFTEVYEYAQKIFEAPIKISLISLAISFDRANKYFDYFTDHAIASHCFHKPISLNLKAFKLAHSLAEVAVSRKYNAQDFSTAMTKYLSTGISPNMSRSIQDIEDTVTILQWYLRFKPHAQFKNEDISFADLCSYIALACTSQTSITELQFFYQTLPPQYSSQLLKLAIRWIIYHRLQIHNGTKINDEALYFFTTDKQNFMSDVDSRLLFQLGFDGKKSIDALSSIMVNIDKLFDQPRLLIALTKILNLTHDDVTKIEHILALYSATAHNQ